MNRYVLEFKRNYECSSSCDLQEIVLLGFVDLTNLYNLSDTKLVKENRPRDTLEREAARVSLPLGG
jgi:hypothetical protein